MPKTKFIVSRAGGLTIEVEACWKPERTWQIASGFRRETTPSPGVELFPLLSVVQNRFLDLAPGCAADETKLAAAQGLKLVTFRFPLPSTGPLLGRTQRICASHPVSDRDKLRANLMKSLNGKHTRGTDGRQKPGGRDESTR